MPLHRQGEARRILHIGRLGRAVGGGAVDHDPGAGAGDALPVQGVGHHLFRPHQAVEHAAFGEAHRVAQGELLLQRAIGRHAMVHPPRQIADLGVKRAAHGDVHLLEPPAYAKEGLAALHAGADQGQRDRIAAAVKAAMGGGFLLAIFAGVHVGAPAGQQKAVAEVEQFFHPDETGIGRDDQGQATGHPGHGFRIQGAAGMDGVFLIHQAHIADDADNRAARGVRHGFLIPPLPQG